MIIRPLWLPLALLTFAITPLHAQQDGPQQLPPRGGERLLRQVYLTLPVANDPAPGSLQLSYGATAMTSAELKQTLAKGVRWHFGRTIWPVLHITQPLQFDIEGASAERRGRYQLPAGRFVVSIQNGDDRRHLVFTRADIVEQSRIAPADANLLVGLGGTYVPVELLEYDHATATPSVRLTSDEPSSSSGAIEIQVGSCAFTADFTLQPVVKEKGKHVDARMDALLARFDVAQPIRHALLTVPGRVELFSLDPDSLEDDEQGEPQRGADRFHGYRILGRKPLDMAIETERAQASLLQSMLRESILAHPDDTVYDCFEPRHGLRIRSAGAPIDLVICFACEQVSAYQDEHALDGFLIVRTWEPRVSACFRRFGLTIAK